MQATDATREAIERQVRAACAGGEHQHAATLALTGYGPEVLSFLCARLDEQRGSEVFSDFLEDFWRGLPGFEWRSTLRSWAYALARHALARHLRGTRRRRDRPGQSSAELSALAERVRTQTAPHLRTDVKDRFRALRAQLPEDDQTLLILRIDRQLSFRELALVMSDETALPSEAEIDSAATRLRKRFQSAKNRLHELARAEGLLGGTDG